LVNFGECPAFYAPHLSLDAFAALNADVAHVLGFIAHERWEHHMRDAPLSCVQRLKKVVSL